MRCKEAEFQRFLRAPDEPTAIRLVRAMCNIQSRRELDTDPAAETRFHQLIRLPYTEFLNERKSHV